MTLRKAVIRGGRALSFRLFDHIMKQLSVFDKVVHTFQDGSDCLFDIWNYARFLEMGVRKIPAEPSSRRSSQGRNAFRKPIRLFAESG